MKKILLILLSIIILFLIFLCEPIIIPINKYLFIVFIILIGLFSIYLYKKNKLSYEKISLIILIFSILIRLFYIIETPYYSYQHDLGNKDESLHLGYIYSIYKTGHLPKSNEMEFYHPPVFHSLGAVCLKLTSWLSEKRQFEFLQYLSLLLSIITIIILFKIIDNIKIKKKYLVLMKLLITFSPTCVFLAGFINNDSLMIMNFVIALYFLFKWNEDSNYKNTCLLALFTGLCVASKMNGCLIAVPILYIFIYKLIKEKKYKSITKKTI